MNRITSFREPGRRYTNLRVIGTLSTVIGVILLIVGGGLLIFGVYGLVTVDDAAARAMNPAPPFPGPPVTPIPLPVFAGFSLLWSFGILIAGLQLVAWGAFLRLMIDLEENTRASAQILDGLRSRLEAPAEGAERLFRT